MNKGNALALFALQAWPAVVFVVFAVRRASGRLARTTAWMMILPTMFLPANLDLEFAGLNKHRIAFLSLAAALLLFHRRELALRDRWRHLPLLLLLAFALGSLATIRTNAEPLNFGILRLPALGPRDAAWLTWAFLVDMYLPFVIGQHVFRTERDLEDLFRVLSLCTLIYAPLCLLEMRLSPQLSNWVYGYFPSSFMQTFRGTGYRPVVFMNHGLSVAMFLFSGFCAALALRSARATAHPSPTARALVTGALLLLGRNLASVIYSAAALALSVWATTQARARAIILLAVLVVAYPVMRAYDLFPTSEIGAVFSMISSERSDSLMFRFSQEDRLLGKAMERPLFGWGNWGRSRIYLYWGEPGDPWAGVKDDSVTDGTWILWLGASGFVGFIASFSLLVLPLFRYARRRARMAQRSQVLLGSLAVLVGFFAVDLIPNAQSDFLHVAYGGALFTLAAAAARAGSTRAHAPVAPREAESTLR